MFSSLYFLIFHSLNISIYSKSKGFYNFQAIALKFFLHIPQRVFNKPKYWAASWRKRLDARLPPLRSRVRVSIPPCGFRGGRNGVWVGFSRGFSRFPLPQISIHHFSTLISFHFIRPCDDASGVVGRHPCYSRTYNMGASSHLIPRSDLVLDTS